MEAEFRKKVFDEEMFECCSEILDLTEAVYATRQNGNFDHPNALLRKTLLDSLTLTDSIKGLNTFIKTLNLTQIVALQDELPSFFESAQMIRNCAPALFDDHLMTLRHLAQSADFSHWSALFKSLNAVSEKPESHIADLLTTLRHLVASSTTLNEPFKEWDAFFKTAVNLSSSGVKTQADFFMTVRHLTGLHEFSSWETFFKAVVTMSSFTEQIQTDVFMTIRHLAEKSDFSNWDNFFKTIVIVSPFSEKTQSDVFMTIRHLAEKWDFSLWDSFFKSIVTLSSASDDTLRGFAVAVRHTLNYFKKPDTYESLFKVLGSNSVLHAFEAYSYGQLESKKWLTSELEKIAGKNWGTVFILAGWIGSLAQFIFDTDIEVTKIRNFELDPASCKMSERLMNKQVLMDWKYKAVNMDIRLMSYPTQYFVKRHDGTVVELYDEPQVIINTSCEHIENLQEWWAKIPQGTRVVVQNNNAFHIPDHINCVNSLQEFKSQFPLSNIEYAGELVLSDYTRYMMIGQK